MKYYVLIIGLLTISPTSQAEVNFAAEVTCKVDLYLNAGNYPNAGAFVLPNQDASGAYMCLRDTRCFRQVDLTNRVLPIPCPPKK